MKRQNHAEKLLNWYDAHARVLPWRVSPADRAEGVLPDPYAVWLSEIMLQQTTVATVKDYFEKFMLLWPDVEALAKAPLDDVLKAWAGLGYYSRARNLHKCANIIVAEYNGQFPQSAASLIKLPGIGPYTSAAIASIAFNEAIAVVDGNVERVFTRLGRISTPLPQAKTIISNAVHNELSKERPGDYAQAVMDLGATICSPKKPKCMLCCLKQECAAHQHCEAETYPIKAPKKQKPTRRGAAFIIENSKGEIWLETRAQKGLLAQMTQVPTTNWNANQDGGYTAKDAPILADWTHKGQAKHTFTHFHLILDCYHNNWTSAAAPGEKGWWCNKHTLEEEALPTLMHKAISTTLKQL